MVTLTENAQTLHKKRYSNNGEDWISTCARVSQAITDDTEWQDRYFHLMSELKFLPNSPTIMNAGLNGTLSACFVLIPDDSLDSIFDIGEVAMRVLKHGGGVGYGLSRLRPSGALVESTGGRARGPVAAMGYYQSIAAFVEQAGKRDGAQMAILSCDHPDLMDFIHLKDTDPQKYNTFNISVAATDQWMKSVLEFTDWGGILGQIVKSAWKTGDPGLYFIDAAERDNPTPELGKLESTNPCGEVPLLPFEACNLGSFNLAQYWTGNPTNGLDYALSSVFKITEFCIDLRTAVRFLDDVIESNQFPDKRITQTVTENRKIGIGVMGWADLLALSRIPYDSDAAIQLGEELADLMRRETDAASAELAKDRGAFLNSVYTPKDTPKYRNATRLCIAPTGSIAILAGCSSGIEPHFALEYMRTMGDGTELPTVEPVVERLRSQGSIFVPQIANEIGWEWHVRHQAAWQDSVDLAVSKTINIPNDATEEDILGAYKMAWETGCKGITVFRDGCRSGGEQVLKVDSVGDQGDLEYEGTDEYIIRRNITTDIKDHRERLPRTRNSITHKFDIQGEECYLTIGLYDDGRPGEIFLTLHREGSATRAWADLTATFMSMLLQHGASIEQLTKKLRLTRFEPSGLTGNPEIPQATSVPDYVGHFLELKFLGKEAPSVESFTIGVHSGDNCPKCGNPVVHQSGCSNCPSCGWERC